MSISQVQEKFRDPREARKVFFASFIGTTFEYYDFIIYGAAAALIFGPQFFPTGDPTVSQLAAFSTFAVGFVTRPLGGIIAGHFGDRIGRKRILTLSLLTMGLSTIAVGFLPNYSQIGVAAPIILVVLRLIQGLAVGAEWGGAALMAVEHAPAKRRSFYGSAPQIGVPAGSVLANIVLLALVAVTGTQFDAWGWRIAFILSVVLVVIGLIIRNNLHESPLFAQAAKVKTARVPILSVLRNYPVSVLLTLFGNASAAAVGYLILTFILSYGTAPKIGYSRDQILTIIIISGLIWTASMPVMGLLADRFGRLKIMITGICVQFLAVLAFFPLFNTGVIALAILACTIGLVANAASYASLPSMFSDLFPTNLRYSGISLGFQFGAIVGGGLMPIIATAVFAATGNSLFIGIYLAALTALTALAIVVSHSKAVTTKIANAESTLLDGAPATPPQAPVR
ncbi:MFS transporter [Arthrobacter sp. Cr_A7]|uniref:MFS transporter n=1 Tax=Arthrobacter sp. Cr_A7 TaxID=3031017 RepID=UPI0023DB4BC5|nr:MFS transporter [Arthrobacter sp. Cr_A7]MDF2050442.1 MFS transporter [Arthrobacter sp. Cr_A7]